MGFSEAGGREAQTKAWVALILKIKNLQIFNYRYEKTAGKKETTFTGANGAALSAREGKNQNYVVMGLRKKGKSFFNEVGPRRSPEQAAF